MTEQKQGKPKERPHGHRDRGRTDEGPHKDDAESLKRTQDPDSSAVDDRDTTPYPKGR